MSGFCGWINGQTNLEKNVFELQKMAETLNRRGPDSTGYYIKNNVALLHKRLAIIDELGGDQPMKLSKGGESYVIVYDGEIYNSRKLRKDLQSKGYYFHSHSDTEVLLCAYIEYGAKCLEMINGNYSFAIWKEKRKTLFIARDRLGNKPLYYYKYDGGMIFASELKALLLNAKVKPQIDDEGLKQLLLFGPGKIAGKTVFKNVFELEAGNYIMFDNGKMEKVKYWEVEANEHTDNLKQTLEKVRYLVEDSVSMQMASEAPLACHLSGGLNSTIICKIASDILKKKNKQLSTFSVDYEDNDKNFIKGKVYPDLDSHYIKLISKNIKSNHTNLVLKDEDLLDSLEETVNATDLPGCGDLDSALFLLNKEISKDYKVSLSGAGADDLFGGYPWFYNDVDMFYDGFPWIKSIQQRSGMIKQGVITGDAENWLRDVYSDALKETKYLKFDSNKDKRLKQITTLNSNHFMQFVFDRQDKLSSYFGIEERMPFTDYRIAEYMYNMPYDYKMLFNRSQGLLKEAFKDLVPNEVINRRKAPFPKTFSPKYYKLVESELKKIIDDKNSRISEILDVEYIRKIINGKVTMGYPYFGRIMRLPQLFGYLVQLEFFLKKYNVEFV